MQAHPDRTPDCPSCGSRADAEYIVLRISDLPGYDSTPRVEISVACPSCRYERALFQSYPLNMSSGITEQLHMLESVLEQETGLPVFHEPPDDPPAGVREPLRPAPSAGSLGISLTPPA